MSGQYKVAWLCEALLVSRSGYYDWKERRQPTRPAPTGEHATCANASEKSLRAVVRPMAARAWLMCWAVRDGAIALPGSCAQSASLPGSAPSIDVATTDSRHGGPIAPNRLAQILPSTAQPSLGHRRHRRPDRPRLVLSGRRPGCLHPPRDRLGHEPNPRCSTRHRRPAHGLSPTPPCSTPHRPLRSRELSSPAPLTAKSSPNTVCSLP